MTQPTGMDAITTTIKSEDFWHFQDQLFSDVCQWPNEGIHSLNTQIMTLIKNCKFHHDKTKEALKIMVLQDAVRYHMPGTGTGYKTNPR